MIVLYTNGSKRAIFRTGVVALDRFVEAFEKTGFF
jgi:hypothetical protein